MEVSLGIKEYKLASEMLVGERKKEQYKVPTKFGIYKDTEVWREPNVIANMIKARNQSLMVCNR